MKTEEKQIDQLFKISYSGLDTTNLNYCPTDDLLEEFNYIYTNVRNNNDHTISEFIDPSNDNSTTITIPGKKSLITEIDFTDRIIQGILSHLSAVGNEWIDILEIPASCTWNTDTVDQIKVLMDSGLVYDISIKNPESIDKIIEIKDLLDSKGIDLFYISLDICPLNFNFDVVTWCQDNLIKIIGYNPMGGYIAGPSLINCFTAPYLLGFAATYCHIVMLSSRDMFRAVQGAKYLKTLEGEKTKSMYILKKNVHKLPKPLKKVIWTSAVLDDDCILPYESPEFIPTDGASIIISLGKPIEKINEEDEKTELEKEMMEFLKQITYSSDASLKDKFSIAKNQIMTYLKTKFPKYTFFYSVINETTVAIKAEIEETSGWWIFKKTTRDEKQFLISMKSSGLVYFKEDPNL